MAPTPTPNNLEALTEREFAVRVVRRLREAGHEALWAGGCVRDELLGLVPADYDVATSALPEEVRRLFRRTVAVGMAFGVVEVIGPRTPAGPLIVQVATFRSDVSYSDGRRPDAVTFSSAREDALRRDFTINGMFYDPLENRLIDYVGGQEDLRARLLRAIGEPAVRFAEDKLRLLRAVRIATRFDVVIEPATEAAMRAMAPQITVVSAERIADELRRLLVHPRRAHGVSLLYEIGLAAAIFPELRGMNDVAPEGKVLRVLELLGPDCSFPLAFAALLQDVGWRTASEICQRLKLSNAERERVEWLIRKRHYLCDARQMRPSTLKAVLAHPGIRELLALHRADALAAGRSTQHVDYCEQLLEQWTDADLNPPPVLTGADLLGRGYKAGPLFKRLLDAVREAQLDGTVNTKEQAWELVERIIRQSEPNPD
jgi:poly(A) polymerase